MISNGELPGPPAVLPAVDPDDPGRSPEQALPPALWDFWRAYTRRASDYQAVVLLSLVYYGIFGPSALLVRLLGRPLLPAARPTAGGTYWRPRPAPDKSLAGLQRQF
jgi:hypothetical protein